MKKVYLLFYLIFLIFLPFLSEKVMLLIGHVLTWNDGGGFMADLLPDIFLGAVLVLFVSLFYVFIVASFFKKLFHTSTVNAVLLIPASFVLAFLLFRLFVELESYPVAEDRLYIHLVAVSTLLLSLPAYYIGKKDKKRRDAIERAMRKRDSNELNKDG